VFPLLIQTLPAQPSQPVRGSISGYVVDGNNQKPVEYANIVLYRQPTQEQVTGTITDTHGHFSLKDLRPGIYLLDIKFIGFNLFHIDSLILRPGNMDLNLKQISLIPNVLALGSIEVTGEKPLVEFKIDKKVINVAKEFAAISGTAVDVLENVPSVSVDIEGNVSLRGSGRFNLLIDGRPSILEPNDALQTIPASTIESIEIVTNPSARFDPDGVSGIINIITRKNKTAGVTGVTNLSGGIYGNYGGDILINLRRKRSNFFLGFDFNTRNMPGKMVAKEYKFFRDTTNFLNTKGTTRFGGDSYGLRGGIDFNLTPVDLLRLSLRWGSRSGGRDANLDYQAWTDPATPLNRYASRNRSDRGGNSGSINLDYQHKFRTTGHEIAAQIDFSRRENDEQALNKLIDVDGALRAGQQTRETGPGTRLRFNADYKNPLQGDNRIEAGYQIRWSHSDDRNELYHYNALTQSFEFQSLFSHSITNTDQIQSTYLIYAGQTGALGYQGGLRGEYTYRLIKMAGEADQFTIDRWDFYPTLHTSLQLRSGQQLMASYTRRIERPRGWDLEPFLTWMDAFNVRRGNPDLKPEFIDSYEAGYQKTIGRSVLSSELYYRITHAKKERIRSVYTPRVNLHTVANIGKDYALGSESMLTLLPFKWWTMNLMANVYDYRVVGKLDSLSFDRGSFNWSIRMNHTLRIGTNTRMQFSANYQSPTVSSQGRQEANFFTSGAIRRDFLNRQLNITLQVRDLFGSARREATTEGIHFYSYNCFRRHPRMVSLTITYLINQYKAERERSRRSNDQEGFDFEDEYL